MLTIGDVLNLLDDELFVGRERELTLFKEWLESEPRVPELLNVSGRGGIGKSALLRAFARIARASGQPVVLVDSSDFAHTPEGFLQALAAGEADPVEQINKTQPLLLLDTFERLGELHRFIQRDFLPKLSTKVKVVIAGLYPLGQDWVEAEPWRSIIRPVPLERFTQKESEEYLRRRDVRDQSLRDNLLAVSSGNPLVLSLVTDMALQLGFRDFQIAPEWHLVLRSLAEKLLQDVDPGLRDLLEAAAVVRQFDEMALAAVSGQEQVGRSFDLLCKLSVVRPAEHGLMLHDDVRLVLCEDLRWRRPDRYKQLRLRALAYYQKRMRSASSLDRERLLVESYFLWENAYAKGLLFDEDELGQVWLEVGRPEDSPEIISIWQWWKNNVLLKALESTTEVACDEEIMEKILRYPGTRLRVARNRDRQIMGFNLALPLCRDALTLVEGHPVLEPALNAYYQHVGRDLPAQAEGSNGWFFSHLAHDDRLPDAVRAALLRDHASLFARGGVYLVTLVHPASKKLFEELGFEMLPAGRNRGWGGMYDVEVGMLDMARIGIETWLEAMLGGRPLPKALSLAEVERALQDVLLHWRDDRYLAQSPLAQLRTVPFVEREEDRPATIRQAVLDRLAYARSQATPLQQEGYRALELAYIQKASSHEKAAERMNVSRTTFYRLLKRGIQGLATSMLAGESHHRRPESPAHDAAGNDR